MGEHTPGPWSAEFSEIVCIRDSEGSRLATINWLRGRFRCKGRIDSNEGEANARLIAAAPDLLEALDAVVNDDHPATRLRPAVIHKARGAISKARGEDQ